MAGRAATSCVSALSPKPAPDIYDYRRGDGNRTLMVLLNVTPRSSLRREALALLVPSSWRGPA